MTYSVGALIACIAVVGNIQKGALILFLPYAVDFLLKARGGFRNEAFAKVNEDGCLEKPYEDIYHHVHLAIVLLRWVRIEVHERDVVMFVLGVEILAAISCIYIST